MAYVLNKLIYTKLFWYDGEQGNNMCLCLSHIFNVILEMGGVFLPHAYITQTCNKRTERYQLALIEHSSVFK